MNTALALKEEISGTVVLPGDEAYAELRKSFVHTGSPAAVIQCHNTEDVRSALRFAQAEGLEIAVRSSGHNGAGFSTVDGGVVIDVSPLDSVDVVDPERRLVRLGTGASWARVGAELNKHGLAISSGDTTSVAVGGLLLGGGFGWMVRKYGLALDSVVAVELVTAEGEVLRASEQENADLFWALRGGGGNFGIATSFEVVAQPVSNVFFGTIAYPASEAAQVLQGWGAYMRTAPEELTSSAALFPSFGEEAPPVTLLVCFAGDDQEAADKALAPLLELGTLLAKDVKLMPYPEVLEDASDLPPEWQPMTRNRLARECGPELVDAIANSPHRLGSMFVEIRAVGGALGRVAADATAFGHRDVHFMINTANLGSRAETLATQADHTAFWAGIEPHVSGAYGNFLSEVAEDAGDRAAAYPAATYARLAQVKAVYDPKNVFRRNINVKP
ncbi:FAD-binding oxidoreductase [Streptomyces sp. Da 82-17]|uniref:FAD-binding oxidoreductase n=1 Tax=Streptomyces sp. Da 82-17 TaxID=3377116 RepID=UPI0038D41E64